MVTKTKSHFLQKYNKFVHRKYNMLYVWSRSQSDQILDDWLQSIRHSCIYIRHDPPVLRGMTTGSKCFQSNVNSIAHAMLMLVLCSVRGEGIRGIGIYHRLGKNLPCFGLSEHAPRENLVGPCAFQSDTFNVTQIHPMFSRIAFVSLTAMPLTPKALTWVPLLSRCSPTETFQPSSSCKTNT